MTTKSGLTIEEFKKLEGPIKRGILEPHIYEGTIIGLKIGSNEQEVNQYCTWGKFGRCSNWKREDCFIDVPVNVL